MSEMHVDCTDYSRWNCLVFFFFFSWEDALARKNEMKHTCCARTRTAEKWKGFPPFRASCACIQLSPDVVIQIGCHLFFSCYDAGSHCRDPHFMNDGSTILKLFVPLLRLTSIHLASLKSSFPSQAGLKSHPLVFSDYQPEKSIDHPC